MSTRPPARAGPSASATRAPTIWRTATRSRASTRRSMQRVDMIEFDVLPEHLDGSGRLLLAHDYEDVSRRTPLDPGRGPRPSRRPRYAGIELDVDLKLPGYEERAIDGAAAHGLAERTLISTMESSSLKLIREIAPDIRLGRSFPRVRNDPTEPSAQALARLRADRLLARRAAAPDRRAAAPRQVDALMCHWAFVTERLVREVHGAGGELYVWTVDDADRIAALERLGADGIITNDPRLFADAPGTPGTTQ